jgi:hypothetical protein
VLLRDVRIPPNTAHTVFQGGRQVSAAGIEHPYCELEIETVSEGPQWAKAGTYQVRRQGFALLKDPTTRVPALVAGIDCSDPLFQESLWLLRAEISGNLHSLRCIRPGYHCAIGPPIELSQVSEVMGPGVMGQSESQSPLPAGSQR